MTPKPLKPIILNILISAAGLLCVLSLVMPYACQPSARDTAFQAIDQKLGVVTYGYKFNATFTLAVMVMVFGGVIMLARGVMQTLSYFVKPLEKKYGLGGQKYGKATIAGGAGAIAASVVMLIGPSGLFGSEIGATRGAGAYVGLAFAIFGFIAAVAEFFLSNKKTNSDKTEQ